MSVSNYVTLKYLVPALIWALIILLLSGLSGNALRSLTFTDLMSVDKWGHLTAYAILGYLGMWGMVKISRRNVITWSSVTMIAGICIVYGIIIEILQYTVFEDRYFEYFDIIANIIGSFLGAAGFRIVHNQKELS